LVWLSPPFFQSGQYLDPEGRKELKELFTAYKQARPALLTSITFSPAKRAKPKSIPTANWN
jgi:hypothetical protein